MPPLLQLEWDSWDLPVGRTLVLTMIALVYLRGWLRLRGPSSSAMSGSRAGGFLLGLLLVWAAMASPIASCDRATLTAHMVQHLLLMSLAPPLILLAAPVRALERGLPRRLVTTGLFRWPAMRQGGKVLGRPTFCWIAATATLVLWHVPALFTLALRSHAWHAVEHVSFLATGLLFWWPIVEPGPGGPRWSTVLYLFLATLPCDILSGFLVFSERVAYPVYLSAAPAAAVLEDQQRAGALMWTCVTLVYLVAGMILSTRLLQPGSALEDRDPRVLELV